MPTKFRKTCEPSSGGIGMRLKKQSSKLNDAICRNKFIATPEPNSNAIRANATRPTASTKFIAGPAIETRMSSQRPFRKLFAFTGTGLAQPIMNRPTPNGRKISSSGSRTVPIGSICTMGLSEQRPCNRAVSSPHFSAVHASALSYNRATWNAEELYFKK